MQKRMLRIGESKALGPAKSGIKKNQNTASRQNRSAWFPLELMIFPAS
jgi:hypothetical protein